MSNSVLRLIICKIINMWYNSHMKKLSSILVASVVTLITLPVSTSTAVSLKPSLAVQMQKQEAINKTAANIQRLQSLREASAQRLALTQSKTTQATLSLVSAAPKPIVTTSTPPPTMELRQSPNTSIPVATMTSAPSPAGVDMARVRQAWMGWYNDVRRSDRLSIYSYDSRLEATAYDWNQVFATSRGSVLHERRPGDGYYNFAVIDQWFKDRGINPPVKNRSKHVENLGYGSYRCTSGDCTDALITSIRSTFDFFMREKSYGWAHYKSIVNPNFSKIGLNIITVPSESRYYITIHYITE